MDEETVSGHKIYSYKRLFIAMFKMYKAEIHAQAPLTYELG